MLKNICSCKKTAFFLFLLLFSKYLVAQEQYKFSNEIEEGINNDKSGNDSYKYQMGAMNYSISNYYLKGLETWDKLGRRVNKLSKEDSLKFTKLKVEDAKDYILNRSKNEELIILNEAHHYSSHRTFATSLLKGLYENGYRYLGIETLDDDSINIRKFPTTDSGFYSSEPQFGNFIKIALDLGFTLFKYESMPGKTGKEREIEQAENIFNFMQKNNEGKYLIYCGYEHAYEGKHQSWDKTMAGRLSNLTKINPFTIDQTQFSEKSSPELSESVIRIVNKNYPVVLIDDRKIAFNGNKKELFTDIKVINPITKYIKGRPNWMLNKNRKYYQVPKSKIENYPCLILAYRKGELERNGVPADVIELKSIKDTRYLVLDIGKYDIILKNKLYKITSRFEKTIK